MPNNPKTEELDAYTQHVMSSIDPLVFKSLNLHQLREIRAAISANAPFRRHAVDVRGTLPLYFSRYYFVFLMGKDRRVATRDKELQRVVLARGFSLLFFIYITILLAIPLFLLLLYGLKVLLGIDLFPAFHLKDLWQ
ncbi:hypothetical protein SAMN02745866_03473 [Alteromonadaceae bacterium Bs31]|nr:hypothetical protein SAMN02745866_03473 [Alteromonadaceae bacterium Bs31]